MSPTSYQTAPPREVILTESPVSVKRTAEQGRAGRQRFFLPDFFTADGMSEIAPRAAFFAFIFEPQRTQLLVELSCQVVSPYLASGAFALKSAVCETMITQRPLRLAIRKLT